MLSIVRRNLGLKVFAVALALAAWAYFHFSAAPGITARFDQQFNVPIDLTGLRPGYVARFTDKAAVVTIDAPRNGPAIKPEAVKAVLNLSGLPGSGVYNVPIKIIARDLQIRSLVPASVTLSYDKLEDRTVPLALTYLGDRSNVVVESATLNPTHVILRGIAGDLAKVAAVRVEIALPSKAGALDAMFRPIAADARGSEVAAVQTSPNLIRVRARFIPSTGTESK
ncbi:MAG: hypothetical protein NVS2B17_05670 [Candidatus Velthaea sp.]